jgi:ribonuclease HII
MDILRYEKMFTSKGFSNIVGIDEAGRGPLAGPVVAVALNWGDADIIDGIKDSKKLSEKKRLVLFDKILDSALDIGIGIVHEHKIDEINILEATYLAMRKAVGSLKNKPDLLLVDGNRADIHHIKQKNIIKGDSLSYTIACASIIAKVTRDLMMIQYSKIFPEYGFEKHKGYGTKFHIKMIKEKFSCPIHRKSFKPISNYLPQLKRFKENNQMRLLGFQITACYMIKNNFQIILFNDIYDIILSKGNLLILSSVNILIGKKTINSKIPLNGVNFDCKIKKSLVELNLDSFKRLRIDFVEIKFLKTGPEINIKKGKLYDI